MINANRLGNTSIRPVGQVLSDISQPEEGVFYTKKFSIPLRMQDSSQ